MAIESVIFFLVAVAVPVWLVVEQLTHGKQAPVTKTERALGRTRTTVAASRAA